jgi:hypothetical protein
MKEVEETSDLFQLILEGIHKKSQPQLNNLYEIFDEIFIYGNEIKRRFRFVMDKIEDHFGDKISSTEFSRSLLFNTLFTVFYDLLFDLNSNLEISISPKKIPVNIKTALIHASNKISSNEITQELSKSLRGGTANYESRKMRFDFIIEIVKID